MKGKLLLLGLIGAAAYGASRIVRAPAGGVKNTAQRAAGVLRERGPQAVETAAQGIEKAGDVTEKGVQALHQRAGDDTDSRLAE